MAETKGGRVSKKLLATVIISVIVIATTAIAVTLYSLAPRGTNRPVNDSLTVSDETSDFRIKSGSMPTVDLSPIDVVSLTLSNDGQNLVVVMQTVTSFPSVFAPYDSGAAPALTVSLWMTADFDGNKFAKVDLIVDLNGRYASVVIGESTFAGTKFTDQPIRYSIENRRITFTVPLSMTEWGGAPGTMNVRIENGFDQIDPYVKVVDDVPEQTSGSILNPDEIDYGLWQP